MRMRPKTSDSPAASRNRSIPSEIPLRIWTIQNSMAAGAAPSQSALLAKGALERDQPRLLQILLGGLTQELIHPLEGLDHHRDDLVSRLVDPGDDHVLDDVLIAVEADAPAGRLQIHPAQRL